MVPWRSRASALSLRRDGRRWTLWTAGVVVTFGAPDRCARGAGAAGRPRRGVLPGSRGRRAAHPGGARAREPWCRSGASGARRGSPERAAAPEGVALGLLGDLVGHDESELLAETGPGASARAARRVARRRGGGADGAPRRPPGRLLVRPRPQGGRPAGRATAWRTCCSRCARTRRASPRSPTSTSPGRRGGSAGGCPSARAGAGRGADGSPRDASPTREPRPGRTVMFRRRGGSWGPVGWSS